MPKIYESPRDIDDHIGETLYLAGPGMVADVVSVDIDGLPSGPITKTHHEIIRKELHNSIDRLMAAIRVTK